VFIDRVEKAKKTECAALETGKTDECNAEPKAKKKSKADAETTGETESAS
jgi:hypothetical protein